MAFIVNLQILSLRLKLSYPQSFSVSPAYISCGYIYVGLHWSLIILWLCDERLNPFSVVRCSTMSLKTSGIRLFVLCVSFGETSEIAVDLICMDFLIRRFDDVPHCFDTQSDKEKPC